MLNRTRLVLAGLVVLLALSSVMAAPVSAFPGPFWRQRQVGESGNGIKISAQSPEKFLSQGGTAKLSTSALGVTINCAEGKNQGHIWNNTLAGQAKLKIEFSKCKAEGANSAGCVVGEPIVFEVQFHLMWKWDGSLKQLKQGKQKSLGQKPDGFVYHFELGEQEKPKSEAEFVAIKLSGCTFTALNGENKATGFESAEIKPEPEIFTKEAIFSFTPGKHLQHFWDGKEQVGLETEVSLAGFPSTFEFEDKINSFQNPATGGEQEVAIFEN